MYFEVNGISFDKYIQKATYQMTKNPEYTEWIDANGRKHRSQYRERVAGSFMIAFVTPEEHQRLIDNLKIATIDEVTRMSVHAQNTNEDVDIEGYYTFTPAEYIDLGNGYARDIMTVTIEEA